MDIPVEYQSDFYSHAPRGARPSSADPPRRRSRFLLTRPSRGATRWRTSGAGAEQISTHTPLAGRDEVRGAAAGGNQDFYSHAPRGARPASWRFSMRSNRFLLTRPSRGATRVRLITFPILCISTHTPLAGRDLRTHNICCRMVQPEPDQYKDFLL